LKNSWKQSASTILNNLFDPFKVIVFLSYTGSLWNPILISKTTLKENKAQALDYYTMPFKPGDWSPSEPVAPWHFHRWWWCWIWLWKCRKNLPCLQGFFPVSQEAQCRRISTQLQQWQNRGRKPHQWWWL